jgi:uncharacterized membrane protein
VSTSDHQLKSEKARRKPNHDETGDPYWIPCDYSTAWAQPPAAETDPVPVTKSKLEETMKRLALALMLSSFAVSGAIAADQTCKAKATDKKLAGAALNSFMTKCASDATAFRATRRQQRRSHLAPRRPASPPSA